MEAGNIGKEKILFILSLIIFGSLSWGYYNESRIEPISWRPPDYHSRAISDSKGFSSDELFPSPKFELYFTKQDRTFFVPVSEKKPLPPATLSLPPAPSILPVIPMPSPCPSSSLWGHYPLSPFTPLSKDEAKVEKNDKDTTQTAPIDKTLKEMLKESRLGTKVSPVDIIWMKNGIRYLGRIIERFPDKVLLLKQKEREDDKEIPITIPVAQVESIQNSKTLEQLYRQELPQIHAYNWVGFLNLAKECDYIDRRLDPVRSNTKEISMLFGSMDKIAVEIFEKSISSDPLKLEIYLAYGEFYQHRFDYEEELRIYLRANKMGIVSDELTLRISLIQRQIGLIDAAINTLSSLKIPEALIILADLLLKEGNIESALKTYNLIIEKGGKELNGAKLGKAKISLIQGDMETSLKFLEDITEASPSILCEVNNILGVIFYLQGKLSDAVSSLKKAVALGSNEALLNLGLVYLAGDCLDSSEEILIQAKERMFKNPSQVNIGLGMLYWRKAEIEKEGENKEELLKKATESFHAGVVTDPRNPMACYSKAEFLRFKSKRELRKLEELKKSPEDAYEEWQKAILGLEDAREYYREALKHDFNFTDCVIKLGLLAVERSNFMTSGILGRLQIGELEKDEKEEAVHYFSEALRRKGHITQKDESLLWSYLGLVYLAQGDEKKAEHAIETARSIESNNLLALKELAYLRNYQGRTKEALGYLEEVIMYAKSNGKDDPYALDAISIIKENSLRVLWEDTFSRTDSDHVYRKWEEEEQGFSISVNNRSLLFSGQQPSGGKPVFVERKVDGRNFVWFEGEINIKPEEVDMANIGIWLRGDKKGALLFGRSPGGALVVSIISYMETPEKWIELKKGITAWDDILKNPSAPQITWPLQGKAVLRIEMTDQVKGYASLYLDRVKVASNVPVPILQGVNNIKAGFFGYAPGGKTWKMIVDQVKLVEKQTQK